MPGNGEREPPASDTVYPRKPGKGFTSYLYTYIDSVSDLNKKN
jgi:hypothetical protein